MKAEQTEIRYIRPYSIDYEDKIYKGIVIGWKSNIGWGQFDIYINDKQIEVHTETRCNNEHKEELELILDKAKEYIVDNCIITG